MTTVLQVAFAFANAWEWLGGWLGVAKVLGAAAVLIAAGLAGRSLLKKLLQVALPRFRGGRGQIGAGLIDLVSQTGFFAATPLALTLPHAPPSLSAGSLSLFLVWGLVSVTGTVAALADRASRFVDSSFVWRCKAAAVVAAAGFVTFGTVDMGGAGERAKQLIALAFWIAFLLTCGLVVRSFVVQRVNVGMASETPDDFVSRLLLERSGLFFGSMLAVIGLLSAVHAFNGEANVYVYGVASVLLLAALPAVESGVRALIQRSRLSGVWRRTSRRCAALLVFTLFWCALAALWGVNPFVLDTEQPADRAARLLIDTSVAAALGLLLWELLRTWLDTLAPPPAALKPGAHPILNDEGPVPAATRLQTFVPVLRIAAKSLIIAAAGMIALAALGVNIMPLLAGAGIVGVAVGFGSQALVKDVISGFFFLADDAFRLGEYVKIGTAKGNVETISVRSLKLRHPRGALYTIPYGEIRLVENQSSDYTIVKLEFLVSFDADLVRAKRVVKTIAARLAADPEVAHDLLQPLKFIGVRRIEQYGLVVGVKFTARPGQQWVLRREVFHRVRDGFSEAGIPFARPQVLIQDPAERGVGQAASEVAATLAVEPRAKAETP